jgi:hypothetical protein
MKKVNIGRILHDFSTWAIISFLIVLCVGGLAAKNTARVPSTPVAEWSMFTSMQANNDLAEYAMYSIAHMESGMQRLNAVNVLVQWDDPATGTIKRYKVVPGEMTDCGVLPKKQFIDPVASVVEGARWMITSYPAKRYIVVLWNHGSGVVDYETYRSPMSGLFFKDLRFKSPRIRPMLQDVLVPERGILYDDTYKRVLTNQGLVQAMSTIKDLLGKKIDVVVMDACYMATYEVGYALRKSVSYLVASQEAESGGGLPYGFFLYPLTMQPAAFDPMALAQTIVHSYQLFYQLKEGFEDYTYSAVDLTMYDEMKRNLDAMLKGVATCASLDAGKTKQIVKQARAATHEMWWTVYVDLYSFYESLHQQVEQLLNATKVGKRGAYEDGLGVLLPILTEGMRLIRLSVVANAVGPVHGNCRGMCMYYPVKEPFHASYRTTPFAIESAWEQFITTYC